MCNVHQIAQAGFDGLNASSLYDRARPTYPGPAIHDLLTYVAETQSIKAPLEVVELGSGTGIFSRLLLGPPQDAEPEKLPKLARLLSTEPSAGMRAAWDKSVLGAGYTIEDGKVEIVDGRFDHIPAEDGSADLVVAAQAWHWCPDYEAALKEIHRVLKPSGVLAWIWNLEDKDSAAWVSQIRDLYEVHEGGTPQYRLGLWRQTFDAPSFPNLFQPAEYKKYHRDIPVTVQGVVDRINSKSYIHLLPEEERIKLSEALREVVERGEGKKWIDVTQGIFAWPYSTDLYLMKRKQTKAYG